MVNDMVIVWRKIGKYKGFYRMYTEVGAQKVGIEYLPWRDALLQAKATPGRWILGDSESTKGSRNNLYDDVEVIPPMVMQILGKWEKGKNENKTVNIILPVGLMIARNHTFVSAKPCKYFSCHSNAKVKEGFQSGRAENVVIIGDMFRSYCTPEEIAFMSCINKRILINPREAKSIFTNTYIEIFGRNNSSNPKYYLMKAMGLYQSLMFWKEFGMIDKDSIKGAFDDAGLTKGKIIKMYMKLVSDESMNSKDRKESIDELAKMAGLKESEAEAGSRDNGSPFHGFAPLPANPVPKQIPERVEVKVESGN